MMPMPTPTQVWLVVEAIDMRAGIDGLSQRIQTTLGRTPCDGSAYAFRNRRQNRLKLLIWDGTGVWLCQRRLHQGHFTWPSTNTPYLPSPMCNGDGSLRGSIGSDWMPLRRPTGVHEEGDSILL